MKRFLTLYLSLLKTWIFEAIGGLPLQWVVKIKRNGPRIVRWKPMASLNINFGEVYSYLNEHLVSNLYVCLYITVKY